MIAGMKFDPAILSFLQPPTAAERPVRFSLEQGAFAGRNEPCPCGSGRKFKKCCGR